MRLPDWAKLSLLASTGSKPRSQSAVTSKASTIPSDHHRGEGDHERQDRDEGKQKGKKFDEAPFFLLVIDDIERVDDRLHSGVGAPKGDNEAGYETEAELCIAFCREPRDLLMENVDCASGKNARGQRQMGMGQEQRTAAPQATSGGTALFAGRPISCRVAASRRRSTPTLGAGSTMICGAAA